MPIYDKPVWKLMYDMVQDLGLKKGDTFSREQVLAWFSKYYPKVKRRTISAHLIRQSTNAPSRVHYHGKPGDDDLFFQIDGSHFRLYDPEFDPPPIYGDRKRSKKPVSAAETEPSLADDILRAIQKHQREWQQRLQDSDEQIRALEQQNEKLHRELDKRAGAFDEVTDKGLRDRLSRLGSPPLDTVIREAGVVLEDRLRVAGGASSAEHGAGLVDAVLSSEKGALIFSSHVGEQQGVWMLYRGAMQFVRNPPMHKLIEYPESVARLFVRLIDTLLRLLTELEPRQRGEVAVEDIRRMLTRRSIQEGQQALYKVLYQAGEQGLSRDELAAAIDRTKSQLAGLLGALGRRINGTEGLEGKGGIEVVLDVSLTPDGSWHYRMRSILRAALEAENIV